jgi:UDP-glucose 4-epimerase
MRIIRALDHLRAGGASDVLNLRTGRGHSVLEVIETARRITRLPIRARIEGPRPGDPARLVADPSRAKALLGWQPAMSDLTEIVRSAWAWKKRCPRGYPPLETDDHLRVVAESFFFPLGPRFES